MSVEIASIKELKLRPCVHQVLSHHEEHWTEITDATFASIFTTVRCLLTNSCAGTSLSRASSVEFH